MVSTEESLFGRLRNQGRLNFRSKDRLPVFPSRWIVLSPLEESFDGERSVRNGLTCKLD